MYTFANTTLAPHGPCTTVLNSTAASLHHVHAATKGSDHLSTDWKFVTSRRRSPLLLCNAINISLPQDTASLDMADAGRVGVANSATKILEDRIVKLIHTPELSVSAYDTAWVAMVASPHSSNDEPCFPNCLNWLLENQCHDGSWASPHHEQCSFLKKDLIMSTLACILALKRWGVGEDQIIRGMHFIELNFASVTDIKNQISPIGFDILFPSMLEYARDLSLNLNLEPTALANLTHRRELEVIRCNGSESREMEAYMAYISEGMGKLMDWNSILVKYQRRNGSLFNSPSATAAACIFSNHHRKDRCLHYLQSALNEFGNAVPVVYPMNLYAQQCMVDNLERLGISQYFGKEIQGVLDAAYRCWLEDEEEITMDASTCAMAFRILRKNGYDLNSDKIVKVLEEDCAVPSFVCGDLIMRDMHRTVELYRASEIIFPFESALEKLNLRLKHSLQLEQSLLSSNQQTIGFTNIVEEVKHVLKHPFYATIKRVEDRRNIEQYSLVNTMRILKTSFSSPNFGNKDILLLSVSDFNRCQQIHREELEELQRWFVDNRLDKLKFAKQHQTMYCYFSAASTFFSPELYEARMSWAKHSVVITMVDDLFDFAGSFEEMKNLIQLLQKWDNANVSTECLSPEVEIIFSALKSTICDTCDKAFIQQERNVTEHIINIWLDLLNSMLKEAEWARGGPKPTMDEYISNGSVSVGLGPIVLYAIYLVGPKISEKMVQHPEYNDLFKLLSICGRLLNDIQSYERELKQGKFNAVQLYMNDCGGAVTEEMAIVEIKRWIECNRRELHKLLLLQGKNSVLPRACKDLFWHMSEVFHFFYLKDDGYVSEELIKVVNNILYDPIPILMNQL